jgi:hypothetical protein
LLLRPREWWWWCTVFVAGSTPPPQEKLLVVIAVVVIEKAKNNIRVSSLFEEKEAKKRDFSLFFSLFLWLFFCGGGYLSLSPFFLSFLSLKHALFLHTFPDAHSHSHLKHTNTIIMSSAVSSSYLALVSLYLFFFFLLSHSFSLSGMCCWCFMIPPGFYLLQNNNQSVTIHTPERVLHRVKQKLTTLL